MRYTRATAFAGLRQALEFHDLLTGDNPWTQAIRKRLAVLQGRPLTRLELWTINKLIESVIGRVLGLAPDLNMATNQEEGCRRIEANNRSEGRQSA
jgi:hypothetical protein